MRHCIAGLTLAASILVAGPVHAITVDEIIGLARADASDSIILSQIEADGTVFHLTVEEILTLKEAGVSDNVITYMINTGKQDQEVQGEMEEPPLQEQAEEVPAQELEPEGQDYGGGGSNVHFSVGLGFGYYYPHWPGFSWSFYYDPFWWPSWPYYYVYWRPWPYYAWYYDPWYYCNPYPYHYYHHHYRGYYRHHGRYYAGHHDYYRREFKGRNVGNRGSIDGGRRTIKEPGTDYARLERAKYRTSKPRDPAVSNTKRTTRAVQKGTLRTPRSTGSNPIVHRSSPTKKRVHTPRQRAPSTRTVNRPRPSVRTPTSRGWTSKPSKTTRSAPRGQVKTPTTSQRNSYQGKNSSRSFKRAAPPSRGGSRGAFSRGGTRGGVSRGAVRSGGSRGRSSKS